MLRVIFAMADIASDAPAEAGLDISPMPIWRSAWVWRRGVPNPALLRNIDREGMQL